MKPIPSRKKPIDASHLLGLRVLTVLVREGSVAAAAERLSISQPAISNALARLRMAAHDPLMVRVGNRNQPTRKALLLASKMAPLLDEAAALLYATEHFDPAALTGRYVLGMPDYLEQLLAPAFIARIHQQAPHVTLVFRRASAETANRAIDEGDIDIALTRLDQVPAWQKGEIAFTEHFLGVHAEETLPARKTLSLDTFLSRGHVMVSFTGTGEGQIDTALEALGRSRQVIAVASSFSALADIVKASPLIASVPHPIARRFQETHDLRALPLAFPVPTIDVQLLHAEVRDGEPALSWVRQELRDTLSSLDLVG